MGCVAVVVRGGRRLPVVLVLVGCLAWLVWVGSARADGCSVLFSGQPLRTGFSLGLPDCRGYEQVNPVAKGGGNLVPVAVAADGNTAMFGAFTAFTGSSGGGREVIYTAHRTAAGWQSVSLLPSATQIFSGLGNTGVEFLFDMSPDLNRALVFGNDDPYASITKQGSDSYYVMTADGFDGCASGDPAGGGCAVNITPPGAASAVPVVNTYQGASSEFVHVLFGSISLVPGDPSPGHDVVEDYNSGSAFSPAYHYRLVGLDNSGGPTALVSDCGTELGGGSSNTYDLSAEHHSVFHAVSRDGSRVFFSADACPHFDFGTGLVSYRPSVRELFVRTGGNGGMQRTVPISVGSVDACRTADQAANPVDPVMCGPGRDATFEGASVDGSRVLFTSTAPEVAGVTDSTENLYEAVVGDSSVLGMTRVSLADGSVSAGDVAAGSQVQGVVRIADDASHVYFVAKGVLTSRPGPEGRTATLGANNLYAYANGVVSFIAALPDSEAGLWGDDTGRPAQVSTDGRFLVFETAAALTPDDTDTAVDVYEYDSVSGRLVRCSGGHDGYDSDGNNNAFDATIAAPAYNVALAGDHVKADAGHRRAVSDDGSYVFFSSSEALQSSDVNREPDVYEWHGGRVGLVSDGRNPNQPSALAGLSSATAFMGSSSSGSDVLFLTTSVLTGFGGDGALDIYDARVGGGFAVPAGVPGCVGDGCQGPPAGGSGPVVAGGSATTAGGGNVPGVPGSRVSVVSRSASAGGVVLGVRVSGAGVVKIAGVLVGSVSRRVVGAGVVRVRVALSGRARVLLRRRGRLRVGLRVSFLPRVGTASAASASLTVKG
jgi:hypothetical protein